MDDISLIDSYYEKYINNLTYWAPEGFISVDLPLLNHWNLLNFHEKSKSDDSITRYFHVIESEEKITLINDQFIVWIVPENVDGIPTTLALIALNTPQEPHLEVVFEISGVYNTSLFVLGVLEKFLQEIQENEDLIHRYDVA